MGGEELKWRQLTHNQLMCSQGPNFCAHSIQLQPTSIDLSDVVTASVYSEKTHLKKLMLIINRKTRHFLRAPEIYFRYETKARKVIVDLCSIQVSLHREPPEVVLSKNVNRKFVLGGETARANPT